MTSLIVGVCHFQHLIVLWWDECVWGWGEEGRERRSPENTFWMVTSTTVNPKFFHLRLLQHMHAPYLRFRPSFDSKTKPMSTSSVNKLTHDFDYAHSFNKHAILSTIGCHVPAQSPSSLPSQKQTPHKVRVVFSKPVHAVRVRGGTPSPTMTLLQPSLVATMCTAPCGWPYPPPPVPPFLVTQNSHASAQRLSFLRSCAVWCSQRV